MGDGRKALPTALRRQLWERADSRCEVCGAGGKLETHHILPVRDGGGDTLENMQVLCHTCHLEADVRIGARGLRAGRPGLVKKRLDREAGITLRRLLIGTGVKQGDVAARLGYDPAVLSRILSGHKLAPEGFVESFREAFRQAAAEQSASAERAEAEMVTA
jgi:hypothetical protein